MIDVDSLYCMMTAVRPVGELATSSGWVTGINLPSARWTVKGTNGWARRASRKRSTVMIFAVGDATPGGLAGKKVPRKSVRTYPSRSRVWEPPLPAQSVRREVAIEPVGEGLDIRARPPEIPPAVSLAGANNDLHWAPSRRGGPGGKGF